jgi:starch-binding outer membrane protein, SusD/RagB family
MKSKIKYIILMILLSFQYSCSDWLNLIPPTGLIREEFWKTKEDVEAVLMGAYSSFAGLNGRLFQYGEMRGDMVTNDIKLGDSERNIMEGNIYPDNWLCSWDDFYKVINYANEVIKNAPLVQKIDGTYTDYQMKSVMSEAYFIRGLAYFYLVRIFKDVPLILEPTENDNSELYISKTDGDQILEYIIEELKVARAYAPTEFSTLEENKGRATKAAFDALIADIALWQFDYQTCIDYTRNITAEKAGEVKSYGLMKNVNWFEIFYPGNSLEGIFEFQFNQSRGQNNGTYGLTYYQDGAPYIPSSKALEMFAFEYGASELYRGEQSSIKNVQGEIYEIWKYVGKAPDGTTFRTGSDQYSCNWIVYRYADVLLMEAEALSQLGNYAEASDVLNIVRERADVPPLVIANSKVAFEDAILNERALELAFEGKRWFDLLRMGRRNNFARKANLIEVIVQKVPSTQKRILATKLTNPMGWYLPIYKYEIERNTALVQNPYYNF